MKTFNVIAADIITKQGTEPFVGLTVNVNGKQELIARTCKQALLDLHKSARASSIPSGLYDNGVDAANSMTHNLFRNEIIGLVGKTGFADVSFYEAGAEYEATEVSSAVIRGEAKVGDILLTTKKGSRIEGFVTFPLTDLEKAQQAFLSSGNAMAIAQVLFGIAMPAPTPVVEAPKAIENTNNAETSEANFDGNPFGDADETANAEAPKASTKAGK